MDMMELRFRMMAMMGGGKIMKVETGTYTPSEDEYSAYVNIPHSLGEVPDFVIAMAESFSADISITIRYIANAYCSKSNLVAVNKSRTGFAACLYNRPYYDLFVTTTEDIDYTKFCYIDHFRIPFYSSSDMLKSGITYHWLVGKYE